MCLSNGSTQISYHPVKFKDGEVSNAFVIRSSSSSGNGGRFEHSFVGKQTANAEVKTLLNQGFAIDFDTIWG